ncbi:hypothetical protein [Sporosarcina limicola]|uniref:J domain-containing protein n=1 Tax=Sporosarcina limicola TaxID=34101 RepID=A0A927MLQ0_9BACL|nr:hypothetical protein [Sporosarcina limicola]MBE1557029.1 hypothetical protein [Sporosarcina limicola]
MFCSIQKIQNKKVDQFGARKKLEVSETSWFTGGVKRVEYGYRYGFDRFERTILDAYKISIHHSYRQDGKVKKKQWSICTMSHYNLIEGSWYRDYMLHDELQAKLDSMGIDEEELTRLISVKLDPLSEQVKAEFELTEEYQVSQKHKEILISYTKNKQEFENRYGKDTYDYIYNIYGDLMNDDKLKEVIRMRKQQEEDLKNSYKQSQSYSSGSYDYSSLFGDIGGGTYSDEEKKMLNEIYRHASLKFHPDAKSGSSEKMVFLNKMKREWKI